VKEYEMVHEITNPFALTQRPQVTAEDVGTDDLDVYIKIKYIYSYLN
jgi:hypothetical protein